MSFTGRTAVVTGGSRGIGRAICLELARRGANVVFSYAGNTAAAEATRKEREALGVQTRAVQGSVADPAAVKTLIDTAVKELGSLDILVNNAGITRDNLAMMLKEEDFDAVIETNLKGAFLTMKAAARPMMKARYGRIVNLSSVVALRGNPGQINYCASKAGLIGMTKSLAKELGGRGVTVNAVAPGYIATDMTAPAPPRTWPPPWPSWPPRRPDTSPARCSRWTAEWACEEERNYGKTQSADYRPGHRQPPGPQRRRHLAGCPGRGVRHWPHHPV